jgi:hypothetical protein
MLGKTNRSEAVGPGEEAIRRLAIETAHLGRLELGEIATVHDPK